MPVSDVQKKTEDGYRLVKFSEVNGAGDWRGKVIQTVVEKNYYTNLKLDGGELSLRRLCEDNSCDKKSITFELKPGKYISNQLGPQPQYAVMAGRQIS